MSRAAADVAPPSWLAVLLETYAAADAVNAETLAARERRGERIACQRGCDHCCRQSEVPATAPEVQGVVWYVQTRMPADTRRRLLPGLRRALQEPACPFLLDGACSVHPMRPLICRQFHVRGAPCGPGEQVQVTRPQDIVLPDREGARRVAMQLLRHPEWRLPRPAQRAQAWARGFVLQQSHPLRQHDWAPLLAWIEAEAADNA